MYKMVHKLGDTLGKNTYFATNDPQRSELKVLFIKRNINV